MPMAVVENGRAGGVGHRAQQPQGTAAVLAEDFAAADGACGVGADEADGNQLVADAASSLLLLSLSLSFTAGEAACTAAVAADAAAEAATEAICAGLNAARNAETASALEGALTAGAGAGAGAGLGAAVAAAVACVPESGTGDGVGDCGRLASKAAYEGDRLRPLKGATGVCGAA